MGRYLVATHRAAVTRDWLCKHCHAFGHATVLALGKGEKRLWFSREAAADAAHARAAAALEHHADRIVSLVRCPKCRERAPRAALATLWHGLGDAATALGAAAVLAIVLATQNVALALAGVAGAAAFVLVLALGDEPRRWRQARRATVELARRPTMPAPRGHARTAQPLASDPYRGSPAPPPIAIVRPAVVTDAPMVAGDPADKPSMLR